MNFWRYSYLLRLALLLFALAGRVSAEEEAAISEYDLEGAFLFQFPKFIEWPDAKFESKDSPIVLSILGQDPFGEALDALVRGKSIGARPFVVRRVHSENEARSAHLLYICQSEKKRLPEILQHLKSSSVVTVADMEKFAEAGGMIQFRVDKNKMRFDINLKTAEEERLKMSSKLLKLALHVYQ